MTENVWEDLVAINSRSEVDFEVLGAPSQYLEGDGSGDWSGEGPGLFAALQQDIYPLPTTADREGYHGHKHFNYWASGYRDCRLLRECCARQGVTLRDYFDFGCASGRVIRHFATHVPGINVTGCDINRQHVDWVATYLPSEINVFQNHSMPSIPLPDASQDLVSAHSVFTHIDTFETAWLMELRRILRPGGLAWITVQTERTWQQMAPGWPLYKALVNHVDFKPYLDARDELPRERLVFRWRANHSYTSNVFYTRNYLRTHWGRLFDIVEDHHRLPGFQDVVVLRKP